MAEQVVETSKVNDYSSLERAMGIKKEVATPAPVEQVVEPPVAATPAEGNKAPEVKIEAVPVAEINTAEMTDDEINAIIEKRTGKKVNIADLTKPEPKSKEELEKEAEEVKAKALSWAIEQGKVKKDQYEKSVIGQSKTNRELALAKFTAEAQAEDKDLTADEAEEMFRDVYHEGDPESRLYKIGQKEINKLADEYRKDNYTLPDYESEYNEIVKTDESFKSYKATIKKVGADLPKEMTFEQPYKYLDGKEETITYKIPVDDKKLAKILSDASSENSFLAENFFSEGKMDEKMLVKKLNHNLKAVMFDEIIPALLKQNAEEVEKRMEVVLGNKRNAAPELNKGHQQIVKTANKTNTYSALEAAMKR